MASCKYCGRDMLTADGCVKIPVKIKGKNRAPKKASVEETYGGRCHDCNCKTGEYHHPGCDMERCPNCGLQLISCGCLD